MLPISTNHLCLSQAVTVVYSSNSSRQRHHRPLDTSPVYVAHTSFFSQACGLVPTYTHFVKSLCASRPQTGIDEVFNRIFPDSTDPGMGRTGKRRLNDILLPPPPSLRPPPRPTCFSLLTCERTPVVLYVRANSSPLLYVRQLPPPPPRYRRGYMAWLNER